MLIIDQNSNILLIYKGLYSTHDLHLLLFDSVLPGKKWKNTFWWVKSWKSEIEIIKKKFWIRTIGKFGNRQYIFYRDFA